MIIQDNIFFKSITSFQLLAKFHLNFVVNTLQTKNDILKRTSQRGSTFIYVPQKRGTPLIGSNVATVLCLHKSQ